jgi:LDH2 family malate/lactate/ureidoglycolate dehydrogenase
MAQPNIETVQVNRQELRDTSAAAISAGMAIDAEQAGRIVDQLEYAELAAKLTHGFVRVPWMLKQNISGHEAINIDAAMANPVEYVDCSNSIGYLAAQEITGHVKAGLQHRPVQVVVARNIFPTNTLGYYLQDLVEDGSSIGVLFGTTPKLVTGPGMDHKGVGTNPLAMGFSHEGVKVISDITTASTSLGQLLVAKYWGGFDGTNYRTADGEKPADLASLYDGDKFTGSIAQQVDSRPDRRLYSVGLVLQQLTGLIAGTATNRGNLTVVGINKSVFTEGDPNSVAALSADMGEELLPGMRSHLRYTEAAAQPEVTLPAKLWDEIVSLPN